MDVKVQQKPIVPGHEGRMSAVVLLGNMHVGKTALFRQLVGNKSKDIQIRKRAVPVSTGKIRRTTKYAYDAPGICSIFTNNEDESVSKEILLSLEVENEIQGIVLVGDAKNLKQSIAVALQFSEFGLPMVFALNMFDEAVFRGIKIDTTALSETLGIDVCTTVAREGIGVNKLISRLKDIKTPKRLIQYPGWISEFMERVSKLLKPDENFFRAVAILLLTGDRGIHRYIEKKYGAGMLEQLRELAEQSRREDPLTCSMLLTNLYNKKSEQIVSEVRKIAPPSQITFLSSLGDWCTQLSTGIPIAFVVLFCMYLFIGSFGATFLVDTINVKIFEGFLIPWTTKLIEAIPSDFIRDMIIDPDFGILPTGVFLALGLVLPVLFCFYIAFGILEDSGYLPRISILLDKLFHKIGLNGKGVIPLVMGFSCVTMAILTTRMLDTKKERIISTFLLILGMPCAPLLAVMLIILGKMPISASVTVFGLIFLQIFMAGFILNKILPGRRTSLLMEIPAMRVPKLFHILKMSAQKTFFFMKEAVPVFIFASFLVFLFERVGGLAALEKISEPIISGFMGLPEKSVQVFIKTFIRRESGATEIEHLRGIYNNLQMVVNLLVMTFLSPCINAVIVLFKERGSKIAIAIIGTVLVYAVLIGSAVNHTCRFFGITFS